MQYLIVHVKIVKTKLIFKTENKTIYLIAPGYHCKYPLLLLLAFLESCASLHHFENGKRMLRALAEGEMRLSSAQPLLQQPARVTGNPPAVNGTDRRRFIAIQSILHTGESPRVCTNTRPPGSSPACNFIYKASKKSQ